jgi:hypothetical protein
MWEGVNDWEELPTRINKQDGTPTVSLTWPHTHESRHTSDHAYGWMGSGCSPLNRFSLTFWSSRAWCSSVYQ